MLECAVQSKLKTPLDPNSATLEKVLLNPKFKASLNADSTARFCSWISWHRPVAQTRLRMFALKIIFLRLHFPYSYIDTYSKSYEMTHSNRFNCTREKHQTMPKSSITTMQSLQKIPWPKLMHCFYYINPSIWFDIHCWRICHEDWV